MGLGAVPTVCPPPLLCPPCTAPALCLSEILPDDLRGHPSGSVTEEKQTASLRFLSLIYIFQCNACREYTERGRNGVCRTFAQLLTDRAVHPFPSDLHAVHSLVQESQGLTHPQTQDSFGSRTSLWDLALPALLAGIALSYKCTGWQGSKALPPQAS